MATDDAYDPPDTGSETELLLGFLGFLREAVIAKVADLSEHDARRPMLPSGWHLAGLLAHLTDVERSWRDTVVDGLPDAAPEVADDPQAGWRVADDTTVADLVAAYREEGRRTASRFADADLDAPTALDRSPHSLRWVLIHLVEETARHAGHADAARELLDGRTGE
ncbi:DinB family protein [Egicoccus sp. AB-alg2]|uniref:DinB family protein n=1 Tax=Egicoccus sp. AB-alg2 TaxID=3242693 RepID=UPI00359EB2D9